MENPNFHDLFKKIKKISGCKNQKEVAAQLGISPQAITDAKIKNKIPETWFDAISEKYGVTKEELCQQAENDRWRPTPDAQGFFPPQAQGTEGSTLQKRLDKDGFDQIMDEFFWLVKEWQVEENGRSTRTAIDFIQEFPKRFEEMAEWQKKRKGKNILDRIQEIKSVSGKV